jgi:hypothetical protein
LLPGHTLTFTSKEEIPHREIPDIHVFSDDWLLSIKKATEAFQ